MPSRSEVLISILHLSKYSPNPMLKAKQTNRRVFVVVEDVN